MTIQKTSKRAKAILNSAKDIVVFTLDNYFEGKPVNPTAERMFEILNNSSSTKLHSNGKGVYSIHVHSNCWYEFESAV